MIIQIIPYCTLKSIFLLRENSGQLQIVLFLCCILLCFIFILIQLITASLFCNFDLNIKVRISPIFLYHFISKYLYFLSQIAMLNQGLLCISHESLREDVWKILHLFPFCVATFFSIHLKFLSIGL